MAPRTRRERIDKKMRFRTIGARTVAIPDTLLEWRTCAAAGGGREVCVAAETGAVGDVRREHGALRAERRKARVPWTRLAVQCRGHRLLRVCVVMQQVLRVRLGDCATKRATFFTCFGFEGPEAAWGTGSCRCALPASQTGAVMHGHRALLECRIGVLVNAAQARSAGKLALVKAFGTQDACAIAGKVFVVPRQAWLALLSARQRKVVLLVAGAADAIRKLSAVCSQRGACLGTRGAVGGRVMSGEGGNWAT